MPSPLPITRAIRSTLRTRDILGVLVRYGFESVVQELDLDRLVLRGQQLVGRKRPELSITREPAPVRLRHAMEELGPTFVKLGQVLSTRPDLIPPGWAEEFGRLQDDVAPVPYDDIRKVLEEEFDGGVTTAFRSIDSKPIGAASIAQVHRAELANGEHVVIKVLRPGIRATIESDLHILHRLAEFAETRFSDLGYSPTRVVEQFSKELERELDLRQEARSTDRMRDAFADNDTVTFPRVFWEATTERVLALEEIHGTCLSRLDPEQLDEGELERVVANGTDAVFRQCLEIGFFHADPHPGNIFVLPGGEGRLCFIDCGMTGHIDPATAGLLADLIYGVAQGDVDRVIDVTLRLGDADPVLAEDRTFRADVWEFISRFETASIDQLDVGLLLRDFFQRVREHRLECPADIVFLIKAITTIEGVGEKLLPSFDLVAHVKPHVERLVRRRYGIGALRRRLRESGLAYAQLVENLPAQLRSLLFSLRRSRFTVNLEHRGLDRLTETIEHASANIAYAVFVGSLVMGCAVLVLADSTAGDRGILSVIGGIGFGVGVVLLAGRLIISIFR